MTASDGVRGVLAWLATYGVHSTLFLGTAWLVCRLRPPRSNANRERLWKLALLGGVVSASLQVALGARPLLGRLEWSAGADVVRASDPEPARTALRTEVVPEDRALRSEGARGPRPPARSMPAPVAGAGDGRERASIAPIARDTRTSPARAGTRVAGRADPRGDAPAPASPAPAAPGAEAQAGARDSSRAPATSLDLERILGTAAARWPGLVLAGWIAVGLAGIAGLGASWSALRRRMLGRERLTSGPLVERLEALRLKAGMRRPVHLSVSRRIASPFSLGLVRHEVCIPAAVLTELGPEQQEVLLAHELAHLVRRDPAWFAATTLLERLLFFQPLNRLARRQLAELAEIACDDWAVRWTGARLALASCLAEVAGWMIGERPRRFALPGLGGQRSRLGQRILRLLDDRTPRADGAPARAWTPLGAGALALSVLAVPGVAAVAHAPEPPRAEPRAASAPEERASAPPVPLLGPLADPTPDPLRTAAALREVALRAAAERAATLPAAEMAAERSVLEGELALLETELAALRAELVARDLDARFADALARIDARMGELRAQHVRVRALLERLAHLSTPSAGLAPAGGAPAHDLFDDQGVPR